MRRTIGGAPPGGKRAEAPRLSQPTRGGARPPQDGEGGEAAAKRGFERPRRKPLSQAASLREGRNFTRKNRIIPLKSFDIFCGLNLTFIAMNGSRIIAPRVSQRSLKGLSTFVDIV